MHGRLETINPKPNSNVDAHHRGFDSDEWYARQLCEAWSRLASHTFNVRVPLLKEKTWPPVLDRDRSILKLNPEREYLGYT